MQLEVGKNKEVKFMGFSYFETTADIGIDVKEDNLTDAFKSSAQATINLVTDVDKIESRTKKEICIKSEDEYGLLYDWITEILFILNCDSYVAGEYEINIKKTIDGYQLEGFMMGDSYNTEIYNYKTEVKAITYHLMNIIKEEEGFVHIRFIVDL